MTLLCALSQKQFSRHHCTHYISMHLLSQPEVGRLVRPRVSPSCNGRTCSGQLISGLSLAASSVLLWFFNKWCQPVDWLLWRGLKLPFPCGAAINWIWNSLRLQLLCCWHWLSWMGGHFGGGGRRKKALGPHGIWGNWDTWGQAGQATWNFKHLTLYWASSFPESRYVMEKWRDWRSRFCSSENVFFKRAVNKQVGKEGFGTKKGKYYMEK